MERPPREAAAGPPRTPPSPPASRRRANFLSFTLADTVLIKALGLTKGLAVLVDATLVRALLVPATMRLLGNLNWWNPSPWTHRLTSDQRERADKRKR